MCPSVFSFPDDNFSKCQWISSNLVCALILCRSGLGLLMGKIYQFLTELSASDSLYFHFWMITLVSINGFSPNDVCIDIVEICFEIADGQISSIFDRVIYLRHIRIFISGQ